MTKKYLGFWEPCKSWICMDKGKCQNKEKSWTWPTAIKAIRRTRKNYLKRNWEFFSTQKLPEVKCTVSAVPLNRRNCQSLEGEEFNRCWREHQQDYEMTWAGQGKAGGCRGSEPNSPMWAKRELSDSLGNITTSNSVAGTISVHIIEWTVQCYMAGECLVLLGVWIY